MRMPAARSEADTAKKSSGCNADALLWRRNRLAHAHANGRSTSRTQPRRSRSRCTAPHPWSGTCALAAAAPRGRVRRPQRLRPPTRRRSSNVGYRCVARRAALDQHAVPPVATVGWAHLAAARAVDPAAVWRARPRSGQAPVAGGDQTRRRPRTSVPRWMAPAPGCSPGPSSLPTTGSAPTHARRRRRRRSLAVPPRRTPGQGSSWRRIRTHQPRVVGGGAPAAPSRACPFAAAAGAQTAKSLPSGVPARPWGSSA